MEDIYTIKTSAFPSTARLVSFRGTEAISRPYRFELFVQLAVDDAKNIELTDVVRATATLAMHADRKETFTFQGILTSIELLHAHASFALFRAVLEPRLSRLGRSHHSRVFTAKSIPDIIKAVLEENGFTGSDYALQLTGSYNPEEHVTQYLETDLAFLSRWMEHLGIYFFFEHDDEKDKLVITDASSSQTDLPTDPVRYFPALVGDRSAAPGMESFRCRATALPASVKLKSYDYAKPTLDISASADVASNGVGEISVYGARFFTPNDATAFAKLRSEELLARQLEHSGSSTVPLRAGFNFTLDEHPLDAMNVKYLAVEVEHFGNLVGQSSDLAKRIDIAYPDVYRCEVKAIPQKVQFRPEFHTKWPRIHGVEHGVIDGAANNDYSQVDDQGRYQVKFFFDESDLKDGKASTWVRMMQPHGGSPEGFHFPLRKGTEVVFVFMGGDPDRPVIAGVVNTTTTPSPITSGNNTRNVIQTGGLNRLEIEDSEGIQKITLFTPTANTVLKMGATDGGHELTLHTDANSLYDTTENSDRNTVGNLTETVAGTMTEKVTGAVSETYSATHEINVSATLTETVGGAVTEKYGATHSTTVAAAQTKTIGGTRTLHVSGAHTETNDGAHTQTHNAGSTRTTNGKDAHTTNGPTDHTHNGPTTQTHNGPKTHTVTGAVSDFFSGAWNQAVTGPLGLRWGPIDWKRDAHVGVTFGATSDTFIGAKHSGNLGVNLTTSASIDLSATASLKASVAASKDLTESSIKFTKCSQYGVMAEVRVMLGAGTEVCLSAPLIELG